MGHGEALTPTFAPTHHPWSQTHMDVVGLVGYGLIFVNRLLIGAICCKRLWGYHRLGVLNTSELKTRFHVVLLMTVPLYIPYIGLCLSHYDDMWQCYADKSHVSENLYRETWVLYSAYRVGLSLQLVCLSMTVLTWSDFLSYVRRESRVVLTDTSEHKRLVWVLVAVNAVDLAVSLGLNGYLAVEPSAVQTGNGYNFNFWTYVNWLFLDAIQLALVVFLIVLGERMMAHIRGTGALATSQRLKTGRQLRLVLVLVVACFAAEIVLRVICSLPLVYDFQQGGGAGGGGAGTTGNGEKAAHALYRWVEKRFDVWLIGCYVLPYDVVSFCLLYLMRAPPRCKDILMRATVHGVTYDGLDGVDKDDATTVDTRTTRPDSDANLAPALALGPSPTEWTGEWGGVAVGGCLAAPLLVNTPDS